MDTSRSTESKGSWAAGACIFSGRADPSWQVSAAFAQRLLIVWNRLNSVADESLVAPKIGYRGCWLADPDQRCRWQAFDGRVLQSGPEGDVLRNDVARTFERQLVESAPDDVRSILLACISK